MLRLRVCQGKRERKDEKMNKRRAGVRLLAIAFVLLMGMSTLTPQAFALGLAGKTIDAETANQIVGDAIREKANAARLSRTYEQKTLLVLGLAQEAGVCTEADGSGMDAQIIGYVLWTLGYRDEAWLEEQGVSMDEAESYLAEKGEKGYRICVVEDLDAALQSGEIDIAAGEKGAFSQDESLLCTRAYFSGRKVLRTVSGEERDYTGKEYVIAAREGGQTLIESLDSAIATQYSAGAFAPIEEQFFSSGALAGAINSVKRAFSGIAYEFERNLIREDRYKMLLEGLATTLKISGVSCVCGVLLGAVVALMRLSRNRLLRGVSTLYVNIVRGTPVVVQLMIIYYIVLAAPGKIVAAMVTFSINSAAYVSEMVRGGILAVDKGQTEAGRSLGLSGASTMLLIVLPQTVKIIIPSLFNEFITLLKETSVVGFIGLMDLSKAGDFIRSRTYSAFFPLIAVALIYLVLVSVLTKVFSYIEGRLRKSDIR